MTLSIRRRSGSTETESPYILHNKHNNFTGRSPGYLPHHQGSSSAFGGGRSHGVGGGGFVSNDTSTFMMTRGSLSFNICLGLGLVLLIFPWVPSFLGTYYKTVSLRDEYEAMQVAHKNLVAELKSSVDMRRTLNDQIKAAEEMNKNLLLALKDYGDNIDPDNNLYAIAEQVEEAYVTRIDDLESVISLWSERKLREKYGETKETLRFIVTLSESFGDSNGQQQQGQNSFVIETARIDKMPYTIDFFQQMVQERLCDGLVMTVKNDPVELIQARILDGPTAADATNSSQTLLFSERSPENSLEKYSVSFAVGGRNNGQNFALQPGQLFGGPGFVVHMHQNKEGSSASQDNAYDIESAFAKVVEGQQLLDSIMNSSRPITIKSIRLA